MADKQQQLKQAVDCLKKTIPQMKDLEIPITPENYFVWYEYFQGLNLELNKKIDSLLKSGVTFTDRLNNELYETYISRQLEDKLSHIQGDTESLVDKLLKELEQIIDGNQSFSAVLEKGQSELRQNPDVTTIGKLVADLIDETEQVKKMNASMEQSLIGMKEEVSALKKNMEELNQTAFTDQLTGIPNRRAFDESVKALANDFELKRRDFCVLFMDIDHFKSFNDTHGHAVGDKVLTFIASILKKGIKGEDIVARYGGEEFVVLLPDTQYKGAVIVGQQLCNKVASKNLVMGSEEKVTLGNITISVGVAAMNSSDSIDSLLERADQALYAAKQQGRNRVVGETALQLSPQC